VFDIFMRSCR